MSASATTLPVASDTVAVRQAFVRRVIPGSGGVYQHFSGGEPLPEFSVRLTINRRRTFRKLAATSRKAAIIEARNRKPSATPKRFSELVPLWLAAGCPGKSGPVKRLEQPQKSAEYLGKYFGQHRVDEIKLALMDGYAAWRKQFVKRGKGGGATVQLDLVTLSNLMHFAVKLGSKHGFIDVNVIYRGRDRYHKDITHARERRPENATVIHAIARELFRRPETAVHGWHSFFAMFTGCRTSELLRLRRDAANDKEPGYIRWLPRDEAADRADGVVGFLYLGRRSKSGINPYTPIGPEFAAMLAKFYQWHQQQDQANGYFSPPYFPSRHGLTLRGESFGAKLAVAARILGLPHVTPHGYRSYFATKLRRDGKRSEEIAELMGDKTVKLVDDVYADNVTGEKLHWQPKNEAPAWLIPAPLQRTQNGHTVAEIKQKANEPANSELIKS